MKWESVSQGLDMVVHHLCFCSTYYMYIATICYINKYPAWAQIYHGCHLIEENIFLNSESGCKVAILDLIGKSKAPDE